MTTIEFDKKVKCGNDFVAVRIIENCENLKIGNIYVPLTSKDNERLAFCKIEDIGSNAAEKTGCKAGDYIMVDRLATFAHTSPVACLKYDSVICRANETKNDFFPLKDMLFVEPDEKDSITNVGGIYVQDYADKLRTGKIIKANIEKTDEYPFEVGQHVMLTKGADTVELGTTMIYIYKKDMIVCSIED